MIKSSKKIKTMLSYCSHRIKFKNKKVYIYVYLFLDHGALKLGKQRKYVAHIKMLRRRKILIRKKATLQDLYLVNPIPGFFFLYILPFPSLIFLVGASGPTTKVFTHTQPSGTFFIFPK